MSKTGDGWKKNPPAAADVVTPTGLYGLRNYLLADLVRGNDYPSSYLEIVDTFKPVPSVRGWKTSCLDELIDGYVNHDPVFLRLSLLPKDSLYWNKFLQVESAYSRGSEYVLRNGSWPVEALFWVRDNVPKGIVQIKGDVDGETGG
jgi:hypothetical protein